MNGGGGVPLPPVPDLIPIAALRKPAAAEATAMGERRRPANRAEPIDRPASSRPPPRQHRQRKASRRRRRRRRHSKTIRDKSPPPRVNPIFLWTRQEDNRIVEVKCEDYDKRNRILITKTAQGGWIAIPRTETPLAPAAGDNSRPPQADDRDNNNDTRSHKHKSHAGNRTKTRNGKNRSEKTATDEDNGPFLRHKRSHHHKKPRRRSTAVQVNFDLDEESVDVKSPPPPAWIDSDHVNVESLLPSHTIEVKKCSNKNDEPIVETLTTPAPNALDNLLAVAELEFNQQKWDNTKPHEDKEVEEEKDKKPEECDYNEEDDPNHIAMDDILIRLEQSLQSPSKQEEEEPAKTIECSDSDKETPQIVPEIDHYYERSDHETEAPEEPVVPVVQKSEEIKNLTEQDEIISLADSSCVEEEEDVEEEMIQEVSHPEINELMPGVAQDHSEGINQDDSHEIVQDHNQEVTHDDPHEILQDDTQVPQLDDNHEVIQENLPEVVHDDIHEVLQDDVQDDVHDDIREDIHDDTQEVVHDESLKDIHDDVPEVVHDDIVEDIHHDVQEVVHDNIPEDIHDDIKEVVHGDIPEHIDDEIHENIHDNIQEDIQDDVEDDDFQEQPTDLSLKPTFIEDTSDDLPEDLTVAKCSPKVVQRSPSQNSEAIQSPQPSGIPAVPPSPDIVTTSSKSKSIFLESLLSNSSKRMMLNSEVTITRQKEPLDLGRCHRKSASPTVTCSEEINSATETEPPSKKFKHSDITLRNLLEAEEQQRLVEQRNPINETPRLLELLKSDTEPPDPLTQLKQLLTDPTINIPDPMLVPKDKFSIILTRPGVEIPKLLKERPELRLPDALAYPHIMQDPNMLVLNIHHLESILSNKTNNNEKEHEKPKKQEQAKAKSTETSKRKVFNELANDIDAATKAAFNQMVWLPCLNTMDPTQHISNADLMKVLSAFPMYQNQVPDLSPMFGSNRFPCPPMPFPVQPPHMNYPNPVEMGMWQEAMLQMQMLRNKNAMESMNNKHMKEYLDKMNSPQPKKVSGMTAINPRTHLQNRSSFPGSSLFPNTPSSSFPSANSAAMNVFPPKPTLQSPVLRHPGYQSRGNYGQRMFPQTRMDSSQNYSAKVFSPDQHYMQNLIGFTDVQKNPNLTRKDCSTNQKLRPGPKHASATPSSKFSDVVVPIKTSSSKTVSGGQPMDLSGATPTKVKVRPATLDLSKIHHQQQKQHHEDIPEVGSTTASIEEMQDAHKHLWHPLFGNQKGYTNPWTSWASVSATGE